MFHTIVLFNLHIFIRRFPFAVRWSGIGKLLELLQQYTLNDNNNNKQDNVYGAVIVLRALREFTRFIGGWLHT